MSDPISEQGFPNPPRRKIPWRQDFIVLARMQEVQRRHFEGWPNTRIAAYLHVDEGTIRQDLKRLNEQWLERLGDQQDTLRGKAAAELADIKARALAAADRDAEYTRAVLFRTPVYDDDGEELHVHTDDKGRAEFRGQQAQHYDTARKAVMDQAKVLAIIVDRQEVRTPDLAGATKADDFDFDRFRTLAESVGRAARDAARLAEADGAGQSVDTAAPD